MRTNLVETAMKAIRPLLCLLIPLAIYTAGAEEDPALAKAAAKNLIAKASVARMTTSRDSPRIAVLFDKEEHGEGALKKGEQAELDELLKARDASVKLNQQVAEQLKVGDSVFSYPGLLALSEVSFQGDTNRYSLSLIVGYGKYEMGPEKHPIHRIVLFDEKGTITGFAVFDMSKAARR